MVTTHSNNDNIVSLVAFTFIGESPIALVSIALRPDAMATPPKSSLSELPYSSEPSILSFPIRSRTPPQNYVRKTLPPLYLPQILSRSQRCTCSSLPSHLQHLCYPHPSSPTPTRINDGPQTPILLLPPTPCGHPWSCSHLPWRTAAR